MRMVDVADADEIYDLGALTEESRDEFITKVSTFAALVEYAQRSRRLAPDKHGRLQGDEDMAELLSEALDAVYAQAVACATDKMAQTLQMDPGRHYVIVARLHDGRCPEVGHIHFDNGVSKASEEPPTGPVH